MRYVFENYGSGSCFLEIGDSKDATIISKHFSAVGNKLGKDPSSIIVVLPDLILWTVDKYIFPDRVSVKVQEKDQLIFKLLFEFEY